MRRALVVERPGQIGLVEREMLVPGPGEIVIQPAACGLCGTDLELWRGQLDPAYVRYPLTLGHEWSGVVEAVGDGVGRIAPGDRVVAECIVPCGSCAACRVGATNTCETYDELGFTREGGASDQVVVPARLVHRLEPEVSLVDAALTEPTSVVFRGLEKSPPFPGERVLVIGDGTIALLAAHLAALWSPAEIVMRGLRPEQEQLARSVGATGFTVDDEGLTEAFDLVIEAAGATAAMLRAITAARRGGRVLLLGLPPTGQVLELPGRPAREQRPHDLGKLRLHLGGVVARGGAPERGSHRSGPDRHAPIPARPLRRGAGRARVRGRRAGQGHARDHQPPTHPLSRPYGSLSGSSPGSARRKSKSQPWSACST